MQHNELKNLFKIKANFGNYESNGDGFDEELSSTNKYNPVNFDNFELPKNLDNAVKVCGYGL